MEYLKSDNIRVVDESINSIDVIRQKSDFGYENDEPLYICNISDIIEKHRHWKRLMPRIRPFYGNIKDETNVNI